jgi:hypothetical protein
VVHQLLDIVSAAARDSNVRVAEDYAVSVNVKCLVCLLPFVLLLLRMCLKAQRFELTVQIFRHTPTMHVMS